jgi:hypothetical protein
MIGTCHRFSRLQLIDHVLERLHAALKRVQQLAQLLVVGLKAPNALVYTLIDRNGRRHASTPLPKAALAVDEHPQNATSCYKRYGYDDAD